MRLFFICIYVFVIVGKTFSQEIKFKEFHIDYSATLPEQFNLFRSLDSLVQQQMQNHTFYFRDYDVPLTAKEAENLLLPVKERQLANSVRITFEAAKGYQTFFIIGFAQNYFENPQETDYSGEVFLKPPTIAPLFMITLNDLFTTIDSNRRDMLEDVIVNAMVHRIIDEIYLVNEKRFHTLVIDPDKDLTIFDPEEIDLFQLHEKVKLYAHPFTDEIPLKHEEISDYNYSYLHVYQEGSSELDSIPMVNELQSLQLNIKLVPSLEINKINFIESPIKIELANPFIGLDYLKDNGEIKTIWIEKQDFYDYMNDVSLEKGIEYLLSKKVYDKITKP